MTSVQSHSLAPNLSKEEAIKKLNKMYHEIVANVFEIQSRNSVYILHLQVHLQQQAFKNEHSI